MLQSIHFLEIQTLRVFADWFKKGKPRLTLSWLPLLPDGRRARSRLRSVAGLRLGCGVADR